MTIYLPLVLNAVSCRNLIKEHANMNLNYN